MEIRPIKRGEVDRIDLIPGHRPAWVGSTVKPMSVQRSTQPRLQHRGIPVDPLVIWGDDDRRTYNDLKYPWGCVCRILSGPFVGSGVIIGPRHVLTASHVLDWNALSVTIEVHRAGGTVAATAQGVKVHYFTKIHGPGDVGATNVDEDYAVIVTDQRIGDRFGFMGVRTYDSSWDDENFWFNIGYPTDIASGLSPIFQKNKNLDEDEWDYGTGRAMTTSADMKPGQSGGPMFGFWSNDPQVVAVASAEGTIFASGTENWCSGGSDLTRLVKHARTEDP
ncbi:serine protease [Paenibacillus sp. N3/727]|uniref:trypsin-like serine peptidase n=1 Tax=Paenibacillus sp. N3/727 TaxID=2925845 RepID=UPI001F537C82|nr:serine protease [Paenibacillus sp. N3/727]UNK17902.1 serine protease [Paenibacillus sp. N3/727]